MTADISEITERNQDYRNVPIYPSPEFVEWANNLQAAQQECLRILRKIEAELDEWRPTMDRFRTPLAGAMVARRARRNGNGN